MDFQLDHFCLLLSVCVFAEQNMAKESYLWEADYLLELVKKKVFQLVSV